MTDVQLSGAGNVRGGDVEDEKQVQNPAATAVYGDGGLKFQNTLTAMETEYERFSLLDDKIADKARKLTEKQLRKIHEFRVKLFMQLYGTKTPKPEQSCSFDELYRGIRALGVECQRTVLWNLFLTAPRRVADKLITGDYDGAETASINQASKKITEPDSEKYVPDDLCNDHGNACMVFLYNMKRSWERHKKKIVPVQRLSTLADLVNRKFIRGAGINMVLSIIITIQLICIVTQKEVFRFPIGNNVFDARSLCYSGIAFFGFGSVFYMGSVMAFWWMPRSWGGLFLSTVLMLKDVAYILLFLVYVAKTGYLGDDCYECLDCELHTWDEREGNKPCYNRWTSDTCECALQESLREHIVVPWQRRTQVCANGGASISDCECDAILAETSDAGKENICIYYESSFSGNYLTSGGWFLVIFTTLDFIFALLKLIFWFMTYVGCGKGRMSGCVCCGMNFDKLQQEIDAEHEAEKGDKNA